MFGNNSKKSSTSTAAVVGVTSSSGSADEATATGNTTHANIQRTQHHSLITIVHAKTLALARTVQKYPRKHRDLSSNGVLGDAVEALEDFKDVEWPPRRAEMEVVLERVPSWLGGGGSRSSNSSTSGEVVDGLGEDEEENFSDVEKQDRAISKLERDLERRLSFGDNDKSAAVDDNGEKDVASDSMVATLSKELEDANFNDDEEAEELHQEVLNSRERGKQEEHRSGKEEEVSIRENGVRSSSAEDEDQDNIMDEDDLKKVAAIKRFEEIVDKDKPMETPISPVKGNTNSKTNNKSISPRVDAAAMEPMHPAVIATLHALCTVISSESKTLKMAETALECITILTNGRYVSGVAGGRVKLEVQRKMSDPVIAQQQLVQQYAPGHDGRDGGLSFLGYVVESITRASDLSSESVQGAMAKALLAIMTCPKCGVHEAAMLQAVRSTFHVYLVGKSPSGKELARRTLVDMLKCVFMRMEAYDIVSKGNNSSSGLVDDVKKEATISQSTSGEDCVRTATIAATNMTLEETDAASTSVGIFASQYHTDSYLLFRALCKLSSKTLPGDENVSMITTPISAVGSSMGGSFFSSAPIVDPLALNSKILSLELILAVFEHCGDAFRNGEKFVYAVQSYLCVSLLKNCMSNQTAVAHLSLKIFLLLVGRFSVLFHPCIVWFPSEPPPAFLRTFVGCFHCV